MSVEQAIQEAAQLGVRKVSESGSITIGDLEQVTPILPTCVNTETGLPHPRSVVQQQVDNFCHQQKLGILAHSIGLGLGVDYPIGYTITLAKCEEFLHGLGIKVKRIKSDFVVTVNVAGGSYTMMDTDRHALSLRAIHFALLRQDPDTDEYVLRRLFNQVNDVKEVLHPTQD